MNSEKEIGEMFRTAFEGYRQQPPADLWNNIQQDSTLRKYNRRRRFRRIATRTTLCTLCVALVAVAIWQISRPTSPTTTSAPITTIATTTTPSEKSHPTPPTLPTPSTPTTHAPLPTPTTVPNYVASTPNSTEIAAKELPTPSAATALPQPTVATTQPTPTNAPTTIQPEKWLPTPAEMPHKSGSSSSNLAFSQDTSVCRGSQLTLFVANALSVRWSAGVEGETLTLFPEEPMSISAHITTLENSDTTIFIHIGVFECGLWIPTAFTPNGDGLNDEFLIHAPADIMQYDCTIYDRSRGVIFHTTNILQGWDGTMKGKQLPFGAYFYVITYRDAFGEKHVEKGQITLIR